MDLQDLEKEIEKIRKKNHDLSNLVMIHNQQLKDITLIKEDMSAIKNSLDCIMESLSGGLSGQGLINRIENLEACKKQVSSWIKVIAAGLLTLFVNTGWEFITSQNKKVIIDEHQQGVVRSSDELKIESKKEDKKL